MLLSKTQLGSSSKHSALVDWLIDRAVRELGSRDISARRLRKTFKAYYSCIIGFLLSFGSLLCHWQAAFAFSRLLIIVSVDLVPAPGDSLRDRRSFEERLNSRRLARVLGSFDRRPSAAHTSVHVSVHAAVHAFLRVFLRTKISTKKEQRTLRKCTHFPRIFSVTKLLEKEVKNITNICRRALALFEAAIVTGIKDKRP